MIGFIFAEAFLSALALVVLGIAYQGLKCLRHRLGRKCPNVNCRLVNIIFFLNEQLSMVYLWLAYLACILNQF